MGGGRGGGVIGGGRVRHLLPSPAQAPADGFISTECNNEEGRRMSGVEGAVGGALHEVGNDGCD